MINLSKLEEVKDLRNVWHDEARDFTPWLVKEDNIALLADAIGIDIEVKERESSVGSFQRRAWLPSWCTAHSPCYRHGCPAGTLRVSPAPDMAAFLVFPVFRMAALMVYGYVLGTWLPT